MIFTANEKEAMKARWLSTDDDYKDGTVGD